MTEVFKPTIEILVYFVFKDYENMMCKKLGIPADKFRDFQYDAKEHDLWHWFMDEICYGEMLNLMNQSAPGRAPALRVRERRRWLSDSFNRGAETLEEATVSAREMAASMERQGTLLRAPSRR